MTEPDKTAMLLGEIIARLDAMEKTTADMAKEIAATRDIRMQAIGGKSVLVWIGGAVIASAGAVGALLTKAWHLVEAAGGVPK